MRYFKKMVGQRIYLSPMNVDDAEQYAAWLNDVEVAGYLGPVYTRALSLAAEREYLESSAQQGQNYAIVLKEGDKLIGNISLMDVDHRNRSATLGLFIGDAEYRSKGFGAEAIRLIVDYGFKWLNLHNIDLHVFANNPRAIACYENVGFREYGRRTEDSFMGGEYVDSLGMEILPHLFYKEGE